MPQSAITVLYFAALRDLAGSSEERVVLPGPSDVTALLSELEQRHPSLKGRLEGVRVAINEEFRERTSALSAGDVVALIPPVSGG